MLKKIIVASFSVLVSACTLHPTDNKQQACAQAQRQSIYDANNNSPIVSAAQPDTLLQKNKTANC